VGGLSLLESLQHLEMGFRGCVRLADVSQLGQGLQKLKSLQHIEVYLGWCEQLADVSQLGQGLQKLKSLLHLDMEYSVAAGSIEALRVIALSPNELTEMIEERDPRVADGQSMFPTARVSEQTDIKCDPCDVAFNCAD